MCLQPFLAALAGTCGAQQREGFAGFTSRALTLELVLSWQQGMTMRIIFLRFLDG